MNLAEIRKKAQNAEAQWGAKPAWDIPAAPAPSAPAPAAAAAPQAAVAPAAAPDWVLPGEPPELEEMAEPSLPLAPAAPEFPEELFEDEGGIFDPAAVILRGRESSVSAQEATVREEPEAATLELLCFRVADEEYAIDIMRIKEIIKPREVTEVPRVPSFVRGILSLRGTIIPIFDMRERLGMPPATSEQERIVVVNRQNGYCGVLVDAVVQVVRIAEAGIEPPPVVLEGIDRDFVLGIGQVGERMLILLDMDKVLDVNLTC